MAKENYWKERVDLLLYEKKNWMATKKTMRENMTSLEEKVAQLEQRAKHLQGVINRVGFDKHEFDFGETTPVKKTMTNKNLSE